MNSVRISIACTLLLAALGAGCASTPPAQPAEVPLESTVLQAEYEDVWQATRRALQASELDIYTRDKRGMFVAFDEKKRLFSIPRRARITVIVERVTTSSTRVSIEAVRERYRMPILRHPGWKEEAGGDLTELKRELLASIEAQALAPPEG